MKISSNTVYALLYIGLLPSLSIYGGDSGDKRSIHRRAAREIYDHVRPSPSADSVRQALAAVAGQNPPAFQVPDGSSRHASAASPASSSWSGQRGLTNNRKL